MDRQGICTAGNLIADVIYRIARYPGRGELTTILGEREMAVGGLACNTSLSLAQLDRNLPVYVSGLIGNDPEGQMVLSHFGKFKNIDTRFIGLRGQTSYTLVLNCQETRERTFFVGRGVGAEFDVEDVKLDQLPAKILHA
ncbi:MAG: carbohydrate kinase family protein, partial [Clostridiales bacterium]|nr:carbohydrate kinase family protein [Clostridiales bacterium]